MNRLLFAALCALPFASVGVLGTSCGTTEQSTPDAAVAKETLCTNGVDDDGDGKADCDDEDCAVDSNCTPWVPKSCSSQLDCGNIINDIVDNCCIDKKCVPPGPYDKHTGKPPELTVKLDFTFDSKFATSSAKPQSIVIRFFYPKKTDGTVLTCDALKALSGDDEATRNKLDNDLTLNQTFRNLVPLSSSTSWGAGQVVVPNVDAYHVAQAKDLIIWAEAWYGPRELQNPTGLRATYACKTGIDLLAAMEGDHFGVTFPYFFK